MTPRLPRADDLPRSSTVCMPRRGPDDREGSHVVRAAKTSVGTAEPGYVPDLDDVCGRACAAVQPGAGWQTYEPLLASRVYDPEPTVLPTKAGITAHVDDREAGRSDVARGTTQATPNADGSYSLVGHKWFTSALMGEISVLAQGPGGLSCFFLPRCCPTAPAIGCSATAQGQAAITRTRPARSSTTARRRGWWARRSWREDHHRDGQPHPLDCTLAARPACAPAWPPRAVHHAQHRKAFGAYLIDQPLMRNVLADLAVEAGRPRPCWRCAWSKPPSQGCARRRPRGVAGMYHYGGQASGLQAGHPHAAEAMECPGGNGRGVGHAAALPRGSGSRHLGGSETSARWIPCAPWQLAGLRRGAVRRLNQDGGATMPARRPRRQRCATICRIWRPSSTGAAKRRRTFRWPCRARCWKPRHPAVAEAFLASRLGGQWGGAFGTLPTGLDLADHRARPGEGMTVSCRAKSPASGRCSSAGALNRLFAGTYMSARGKVTTA